MIYRVRTPSPPLRPFIENLWYHEGLVSETAIERMLPDGSSELIVDLTDTPKRWFDADDVRRFTSFRDSWVSGQHRRHIIVEGAKNSCMIGAHFRPGGAHPFFGLPMCELNDSVVETEHLWSRSIDGLRDRLLSARSVEERFSLLDDALLLRARGRLRPDRELIYVLEKLATHPGRNSIREVAEDIGVTQKRLVSLFRQKVGLTPKLMARVFRFQRVIRELERVSRVSWSFIALDAGYFDQAHFIRDFQSLSGMNPSQYLVDKGEFLNWVPIR